MAKSRKKPQNTQNISPANNLLQKPVIQNAAVDPRKEYLSGGILSSELGTSGMMSGIAGINGRVLGTTKDDLVKEFGIEIYRQMYKDPKIHKCIKLLKVNSLGDGVEFLPCLSDNDPNYEAAKRVSDFCTYAIKGLNKPLKNTLEQMLDALVYGHKIAEIVYKNEYIEEFGGTFLTLQSIKPKPIGVARFVVDNSFNVLGIVGTNRIYNLKDDTFADLELLNSSTVIQRDSEVFVLDENGQEHKFLNIDKFMILTIDTEDEDPRGRSMLRAAFNFWHLKQQIIPEVLRFLLVSSLPLLVGFTPEDQSDTSNRFLKDTDGNIQKNANGTPIVVNPELALLQGLVQARNATAIALRGGSKVEEVGGKGTGLSFFKALGEADSQIEQSILLQSLAVSEGKFSSRAQSETHMGVLENLTWDIKKSLADMVVHYLLKPLIKYNFGDSFIKYMPVVSLGDTERRNFSLEGSTVATLYGVGYLSEDQKRYADQMLGLPVRDSNYDQFRNITPDEALRYSDAVLKQSQLETDIKKSRELANLERVNQIVGLQTLLQPKSSGLNGATQKPTLDPSVVKAINDYTVAVLKDIEADKLANDEIRILETLTGIGSRAQKILTPQKQALGKLENLPTDKVVDTSLLPQRPSPGDGNNVPQSYVSTKAKRTTFSNFAKRVFGKNL